MSSRRTRTCPTRRTRTTGRASPARRASASSTSAPSSPGRAPTPVAPSTPSQTPANISSRYLGSVLAACAAVLVAGCSGAQHAAAPAPTSTASSPTLSCAAGGRVVKGSVPDYPDRPFLLAAAGDGGRGRPLVIALHGSGGSPE